MLAVFTELLLWFALQPFGEHGDLFQILHVEGRYSLPHLSAAAGHVSANIGRRTNAGLMLSHCLRRWPNIKPAVVQRLCLPVHDV